MNILNTKNLIFGFIVSVTILFSINLYSNASGLYSDVFNIKHSTTTYTNPDNYTCTVNLSGNPSFSITKENLGGYVGDYINATLKITTSAGTFDIKSTSTYISSSTSTSNLGFNGLGSITLPGYFINCYIDYSSGSYNGISYGGNESGSVYQGSTYTTYTGTETGTAQVNYSRAIPGSIGNSSYASYTNNLISNDDSNYNVSFDLAYFDGWRNFNNNTAFYIANPNIIFTVSNPNNSWGYDAYLTFVDENTILVKSESFTNSNTSVNSQFYRGYYNSRPILLTIKLWGINSINQVTFNSYLFDLGTQSFNYNVIDVREQQDWNDIEESEPVQNLDNLNRDVSENMAWISDFESGQFDDFTDSMSQFDFTGSDIPNSVKSHMQFVSGILATFYSYFPSEVKWLFRFTMTMGIVLMLLHCGTFYNVKLSNESLKDTAVKVKGKSKGK